MHLADAIADFIHWIWDEVCAWRYRRRQREEDDPAICRECGHVLEGSLQADLPRCPECGWMIPRMQRAEWRHRKRRG